MDAIRRLKRSSAMSELSGQGAKSKSSARMVHNAFFVQEFKLKVPDPARMALPSQTRLPVRSANSLISDSPTCKYKGNVAYSSPSICPIPANQNSRGPLPFSWPTRRAHRHYIDTVIGEPDLKSISEFEKIPGQTGPRHHYNGPSNGPFYFFFQTLTRPTLGCCTVQS
jgi:hypothetical protein